MCVELCSFRSSCANRASKSTFQSSGNEYSFNKSVKLSSNVSSRAAALNQSKILPQFNFNIQVQLPENGTPEVYDAIFKSMSEHLLKNYGE